MKKLKTGKRIKEFFEDLKKAAEKTKKLKSLLLVFHDDADGVCSAAIIKACLTKIKNLVCLEKLYPEVLELIHEKKLPVIYVDIASPHEEIIAKYVKSFTLVLDHHEAEKSKEKSNITNINPHFYGIDGGKECSASTLCWLFSKYLEEKKYEQLANLAVIGSTGDLQKKGLNKLALDKAKIKNASEIAKNLTILASVGYYEGGPEKAINAALFGFDDKTKKLVKGLEEKRKKVFAELKKIKIRQGKKFCWFHSFDMLSSFGVKTIGSFCSYLAFQPFRFGIKKPLLGFMNIKKEIPGLGKLKNEYVKASARIPRIPKGIETKINLGKLFQKACEEFGGIGEGHKEAASGVILKGNEEKFIARLDELA